MKTNGKIAVAALAGAAIGATLGILFAPAKGSETRKKIGDAATNAKAKTAEYLNNAKDTIAEKAENAKEAVKNKLNNTLEKA